MWVALTVAGSALGGFVWLTMPARNPDPRPGSIVHEARVVWSPGYRVSFFGIERLHPSDTYRSDRVAGHLVAEGLLDWEDFAVPAPATDAQLARVHDEAYLQSLHRTAVLARAIEVGVPDVFPESVLESRVRRAFRLATGGTTVAARAALETGLGINLGGGFHHARPALGHGFCIYGDVALAIATLRDEGFDGRVLIVDTDAHQGDGNHAFFASDPSVFSLSVHQGDIFPHPKLAGDLDLPLAAGTGDDGLMKALDRVEAVMDAFEPRLVFHVAGSDVLYDDPLAELSVSVEGLVQRDLRVLEAARERGIPLVHTLAGGYGPSAAVAQSKSVAAMLRTR